MSSSQEMFSTISLFSGAMGLDIGLEQTGLFQTRLAVDSNQSACETIRTNRDKGRVTDSNLEVINADLGDVSPEEIFSEADLDPNDIDVVCGGPPCVSFSTAGERNTLQDTRGELIFTFLEFVDYVKPDFFLMENVRGLMSAAINHRPVKERPKNGGEPLEPEEKPGSVLNLWLRDLIEIDDDYRVDIFEMNSVNYGAPQIRERVLFFGNNAGIEMDPPEPTHYNVPKDASIDQGSVQEYSDSEENQDRIRPFSTLGDAIRDIDEESPIIMDFSPRKKKYLNMVPPGGNWRALPEDLQEESMGAAYHASGGRSGWWRRLSYDYPAPTILGQPNHSSSALCHPEEVRALTLHECASVQEFPQTWEFEGKPAEQYKQVGNAVPITLGRVAGSTIQKSTDQAESPGSSSFRRSLPMARKVYIHSHVRRRYWYKDGEKVVHDGENSDVRYEIPEIKIEEESIDFQDQQKQSALGHFSS